MIDSNICVSVINDLTLKDYYSVRKYTCHGTHVHSCTCDSMLQVAAEVIKQGIVSLSETFKRNFPNITYHSRNAKRLLLQMPLVSILIRGELFLMEKISNFNYSLLTTFFEKKLPGNQARVGMSKDELKQLMVRRRGNA